MKVWLILPLVLLATEARAACSQGEEVFTSCELEGQKTELFVCFTKHEARLSYGPIGGTAELTLSETIENLDFYPWQGVGGEIAESVTFHDGVDGYKVVGGFAKLSEGDEPLDGNDDPEPVSRSYGWMEKSSNGEVQSRLECIHETVNYVFGEGIYDLKIAAGLKWDDQSKTWKPAQE